MNSRNEKLKGNVYICYGEDLLKGHLLGKDVNEVRTKIGIYNKTHKDKIVSFRDPIKKREYTVR